jgi:charged multivesicular body protein 7
MSPKLILALLCLGVAVSAQQQQWTNLKVHFSVNPLSKYYFQTQPRQVSSMKANSWTNLSGDDCTNGGKYNGFRYIENAEEPGMALLYDVQGTIAGIQMILDKATIEANNDYHFSAVPIYNPDTLNGQDVYVLTAYFVDPQTICTTGRPSSELTGSGSSGTGTVLQVQNGPTPDNLLLMPRNRTTAISQGWSKNQCFIGMGYHNFYKVEDMASQNCLETVPLFGLYDNKGDQIGFGFAATGKVVQNHFENPPSSAVKMIVGPTVPQCLLDKADNPGLTTMHVFFTDKPYLYACIL